MLVRRDGYAEDFGSAPGAPNERCAAYHSILRADDPKRPDVGPDLGPGLLEQRRVASIGAQQAVNGFNIGFGGGSDCSNS